MEEMKRGGGVTGGNDTAGRVMNGEKVREVSVAGERVPGRGGIGEQRAEEGRIKESKRLFRGTPRGRSNRFKSTETSKRTGAKVRDMS